MRPSPDQIKSASKDVAWEYVALLGAGLTMANAPHAPVNHLVQGAFLVHVRNLAEFFREGVREFNVSHSLPDRAGNILAVDFCSSVGWQPGPFASNTKLVRMINQSLSHMSYARESTATGHVHFDGYEHAHGIVKLIRETWGDFLKSVKSDLLQPKLSRDIRYWLVEHTKLWSVPFDNLETNFEIAARQQSGWILNQTPDGPVPDVGA